MGSQPTRGLRNQSSRLAPVPSAVVFGAGVLGASVADRLARSGWEVTLVERWWPGHVAPGSGGEARLIRCAHGSDE